MSETPRRGPDRRDELNPASFPIALISRELDPSV
jgi:hypothetical protein